MNRENAQLADELRQQMKRKVRWVIGLSLLGLGLPLAAAYLALVLFVRLSALYPFALAGVFLLLVALASFGLAQLQRSRAQRSIALIAVADELGLAFRETAAAGFAEELRCLEMFSAASGIAASNVLTGHREGLTVTALDCLVAAGQATFENTVFVLRNVSPRIPDFYLTPRDFLSRRSPSIDIPKQPEFNKRFLLRGENTAAIRRAVNQEVIDLCLAMGELNVEVSQPLVVVMRRGKRLPPEQYQTVLSNCIRLAKALGVLSRSRQES